MKFLSFGVTLLTTFLGHAHAQEIISKPSVFYSCILNNANAAPDAVVNAGVDCDAITEQLTSKLNETFNRAATENEATIKFSISRDFVNQNFVYQISGHVLGTETHLGPIPIEIDATTDSIAHLNRLIDPIEKILLALSSTISSSVGEEDSGGRLQNWVMEINAQGSHQSNGGQSSNTNAYLSGKMIGSYPKQKYQFSIFGNYIRQKQPLATGPIKGNTFQAGAKATISHSLGKLGEKRDNWSFAVIAETYSGPKYTNIDGSLDISAGVEWNLIPFRVESGGTTVIFRTGVTGSYNNYHQENIRSKMHEVYASMFANFYLLWYSKNEKINVNTGISAMFRVDDPKFSRFAINSSANFRVHTRVILNASFRLSYIPKSITDPKPIEPDPNQPVQAPQEIIFYNNFSGFSTFFSGGIKVTLGKGGYKVPRDQRWMPISD